MTKFALFLTVCSFITLDCEVPVKHPYVYNSWYDCMAGGHLNSLKMLQMYVKMNLILLYLLLKLKLHLNY